MENRAQINNTFQKLTFTSKIPFWLYWVIVGFLIFIIGDIMILVLNEKRFLFSQIVLCSFITIFPIFINVYHELFHYSTSNLNVLFEFKEKKWDKWMEEEERSIFSLSEWFSKIIVFGLTFLALLTFIYLDKPFKSLGLVIFSGIAIFIFVFLGAITIKISISLLLFLRKLSLFPTIARFYLFPHPELLKLLRFFSSLSILISIGYIIIVLLVWFGPYGFNNEMLIWLSIIAIYPITVFSWSYFHIHFIQQNIKFSFISLINSQVHDSLLVTLEKTDSTNIDKLDKFMSIQAKLHELKEYPFEIGGLITFLITTAIAVIQIVISVTIKGK